MAAFIVSGGLSVAKSGFSQKNVSRAGSNVVMLAKSKAIPFLEAPSKLDGSMTGDAGFDPLFLSDMLDLKYLRSAELKHGRICMLATLGWIVQEIVHLPGDVFSEKHALEAIYKVPMAGWWQIIAFISLIELVTFKKNYDDSEPGSYGFDPLNLGKPGTLDKYKLAELKNGRLAMVAFVGFVMQYAVSGQGVIEQLTNFKALV
mmetsp:Transcript_4826/g.8425  ORF Transcript_4826/g.8425 Transcript_4826/m.8425 type:complete len:203 (-) Transcript_4826:31-639(-)